MSLPPFISVDSLCGYVAMWASHQSPYHAPDGLVEVLRDFHAHACDYRMEGLPESWPCIQADSETLNRVLKDCLFSQHTVAKWNERKNGRDGHGFVSRYDGPRNPDDDFIDLDALRMNIVRSAIEDANEEREITKSTVSVFDGVKKPFA